MVRALAVLGVLGAAVPVGAEVAEQPRRPDATWRQLMRGPYRSSRLFVTPVADTVGPYILAISYDGSLLQEPGILSSAGVLAIGFGDIAQLEYRHTSAISLDEASAPVPAVGVQLAAPLPRRPMWPSVALAFRLGVPRRQDLGGLIVDETVTDLYLVARQRLPLGAARIDVHGGVRMSSAELVLGGSGTGREQRRLFLPAGGIAVDVGDGAVAIAEVGLAPSFDQMPGGAPMIGTGVIGRVGVRWFLHPALSFDASVGYQVDDATSPAGIESVVDWDIRLGGELFVPWGAIACRTASLFCS